VIAIRETPAEAGVYGSYAGFADERIVRQRDSACSRRI
jgi:hypothetical protein